MRGAVGARALGACSGVLSCSARSLDTVQRFKSTVGLQSKIIVELSFESIVDLGIQNIVGLGFKSIVGVRGVAACARPKEGWWKVSVIIQLRLHTSLDILENMRWPPQHCFCSPRTRLCGPW